MVLMMSGRIIKMLIFCKDDNDDDDDDDSSLTKRSTQLEYEY